MKAIVLIKEEIVEEVNKKFDLLSKEEEKIINTTSVGLFLKI